MNNIKLFKELIINSVINYDCDTLWLSGGVDSGTILAALLELNKKPKCITFEVDGYASNDLIVAQSMCKKFSVPLEIVTIDKRTLYEDLQWLVRAFEEYSQIHDGVQPYKTYIQVAHCSMHILKRMESLGYSQSLTGFFDEFWGLGRKGQPLGREGKVVEWNAFRFDKCYRSTKPNYYVEYIARQHFNIDLFSPYTDKRFLEFMLSLSYEDMHFRNKEKAIAIYAFADFWKQGKWYREKKAMQVESGVRSLHDTLLQTHNPNNHKDVFGIYNDVLKGRV